MNPPPFTFYFLFNKVFKVSVEKFYLTGYMSRDVTLFFALNLSLIQRVSINWIIKSKLLLIMIRLFYSDDYSIYFLPLMKTMIGWKSMNPRFQHA